MCVYKFILCYGLVCSLIKNTQWASLFRHLQLLSSTHNNSWLWWWNICSVPCYVKSLPNSMCVYIDYIVGYFVQATETTFQYTQSSSSCSHLIVGRCGRHNSPPASSVMDLVFCCPDSCHVSVDTVHPSLPWSSSSPKWYHLQSFFFPRILGLVSSHVQTTSALLSCTSLRYSLPSASLWCYRFPHGLLVCGRMPIYNNTSRLC